MPDPAWPCRADPPGEYQDRPVALFKLPQVAASLSAIQLKVGILPRPHWASHWQPASAARRPRPQCNTAKFESRRFIF